MNYKAIIKKSSLLFGLLCLFCGTVSAASNPLVIRLGIYENKPKVFTNNAGKVVGIFPDILKVIAEREDWQINYVPGNWTESLARLEKGEIDVMVDVAYSTARAEKFVFSNESIFINWAVIYTREGVKAESLLDLGGRKIAVMKGSIHTEGEGGIKQLLEQFHIQCEFVEVDNYKEVFVLLDTGAADMGVVNRLFGTLHEKDYDLKKTTIIFNPRHLKYAFPKNGKLNHQLVPKIDVNLKRLKNSPNSVFFDIIDSYLSDMPFQEKNQKEIALAFTKKEKTWIEDHPVIRLGVDPEFLPFEYIGDDGSYSGIASDYVNLLNQRLGLNMQIVPGLTWREAVEKTKNGEVDMLPCVGKTEERQSFLNFSKPYIEFQRVIITRSNTPFVSGINDIQHMKVAVQENTSHAGFIRENTNIKPMEFPTLESAVMAVSSGKVDAFIGNVASSTYWIRKLNLTNLKIAAPVSSEIKQLHFAVRKDWPELVRIINRGLASISTAERNEIHQRWVAVEYKAGLEPGLLWKYVTYVLAGSLLIFIFFTLWNYKLKKEISERKAVEKKLQANVEFEHFITDISSRFINLRHEEIDQHIEESLAMIASFVGVGAAYLLVFAEEGKAISCTHLWHKNELVIDKEAWQNIESRERSDWLTKLQKGETAVFSSPAGTIDKQCPENKFLLAQGIQSSVDVPRSYQGKLIGCLGLFSVTDNRFWADDEINLLNLVGQIFTNALMQKKAEKARQDHSDILEQKSHELERSQKALTYLLEDINEAKNKLEIVNEKLKDLDRLKSMFIASMSHELRTPLNSIIGFTGIILQGMTGEINDEQKDQLQRVYGAAKHLLALITDVIDISKIEAGRVDVYAEEFYLDKVIEEAVANISTKLNDKGLELAVVIPEGVRLYTDRRRFLQCILNYLSNAVRYTEKGKISLSATVADDFLEVRVVDSGIGIKNEDISKLFNSFIRLDSHLKTITPGTGLGLYLTKKIITEMLGGNIGVESTYGQGSTFIFSIPLKYSHEGVKQ